MATSTRIPAFTVPSDPLAEASPHPAADRSFDAARVVGLITICILCGASLHFLNLL